jgi:hypothetical protein
MLVSCLTLKMTAAISSETSVNFDLHSVTFYRTEVFIAIAVRTSDSIKVESFD